MKTLIKNGNIVFFDKIEKADLLISDGIITKIEPNLRDFADEVVDATDKCIFAGFVDIHVHLREPGFEYKETIESGTKAAVKGGVTAVACMPNTNPVLDNKFALRYVLDKANEAGFAKVYPVCSITKGENGELMSDMLSLKDQGAVAFSDDGKPVKTSQMMRLALEYSKEFDLPILCHAEDMDLTNGGVVHEGYNSTIYGLRGINRASEEVGIAREIIIAANLGARVHICHVSTKGSVEIIRAAKKLGVKVTAETCPHYFSLTDDMIANFNTMAKVNPPLRETEDMLAIRQGIADGTLEVLATDHAPHAHWEKECQFDNAAFGISGLETAFAVNYTYLVKQGIIDLPKLSTLMTKNPCKVINVPNNGIAVGEKADITIIDLNKKWTVDSSKFVSKGKNTPFNGMELYGLVEMTFVDGNKCYVRDDD
ncbi:MAG: dihydroorotase [Clostridia bacterium]|nr:dihydroorotase [Clostridia bacterium]